MTHDAIALLAHGSPDPDWLVPVQRVAARLRELAPGVPVVVATLEHGPDLGGALADLQTLGCKRVCVVPAFLSAGGRHLKRDIPELVARLRDALPGLELSLSPGALGDDPGVTHALAAAAARRAGLDSPA